MDDRPLPRESGEVRELKSTGRRPFEEATSCVDKKMTECITYFSRYGTPLMR